MSSAACGGNVCCHIFDRMPEKGQKASFVSRVGMTVLTVVLIVLFFFIMMLVSRIQGTARVVNYAGLVRGETQRIIKLEGAGLPQDGMIEDVASFAAFAAPIEQIAVSANENLSVNNDISVSLSITFYEKQI